MPRAKKSTLSESEQQIIKEANTKVEALISTSDKRLSQRNKRDYLQAGIFATIFTGLIVWSLSRGKLETALLPMAILPWILLTLLLNLTINRQRNILDIVLGVRDIEDETSKKLKESK